MNTKLFLTGLAVGGLVLGAQATTITWNSFGNNVDLGSNTKTFFSSGYGLTAYGYTTGGAGVNLYGKNEGSDETGLGLVGDPTGDYEITTSDFIQFSDVITGTPTATLTGLSVGSVQNGESAKIYGSNTQGTLGTLLTTIANNDGSFSITSGDLSLYTYFSVTAGADNVLVDSVSATYGVPDGGSTMILLGMAGLGLFGFVRRYQVA